MPGKPVGETTAGEVATGEPSPPPLAVFVLAVAVALALLLVWRLVELNCAKAATFAVVAGSEPAPLAVS